MAGGSTAPTQVDSSTVRPRCDQRSSRFIARRAGANSGRCATLKHMAEVGIRALKQNASAVVADAAAGQTVTITDRGRHVARMSAIPKSRLAALIEEGRARPAHGRLTDLPVPEPGPDLSSVLQEMRSNERY